MPRVLVTAQAAAASALLRPACCARQQFRSSATPAAPARTSRKHARWCQQHRRRWSPAPALSDDDAASPAGLQAVQELDALIDVLMSKKNPQDLAQAVSSEHQLHAMQCCSASTTAGSAAVALLPALLFYRCCCTVGGRGTPSPFS